MNHDFENLLANQCAPLLCGKKPAILLAEKNLPANCEWRLLHQYGFRVLRLRWRNMKTLVFIYNPALLNTAVSYPIVIKALRKLGYSYEKSLNGLLAFLFRRFSESDEFPHEIRFFLGYPPEDVIGFLSCEDSCKLCGQWKVYSDVNRAATLFDEYARCKQSLLEHIRSGKSIFTMIPPVSAGSKI